MSRDRRNGRKNPDQSYSSESDSEDSTSSRDDTVGHLEGAPGTVIDKRYTIIKQIGLGTFGKVFLVNDSKHNDTIALKVVRKIKRYISSAKIEASILDDVYKRQKRDGVSFCVKMYSHFHFEGYYCLAFEPLGMSLYDFIKKNDYRGFSLPILRSFAYQLLQAIAFLQSMKLIHADLKLENILLVNGAYELVYLDDAGRPLEKSSTSVTHENDHNSNWSVSSGSSNSNQLKKRERESLDGPQACTGASVDEIDKRIRTSSSEPDTCISAEHGPKTNDGTGSASTKKGKKFRQPMMIPLETKIKVIDLGAATYDDQSKSTIINTRQYRGPEVTLEIGWSYPSDVWSVGCMIAELFGGDMLFSTHENLEHLGLMEVCMGPFPRAMVDKSRLKREYFHRDGTVRWDELPSAGRRYVREMQSIEEFCCAKYEGKSESGRTVSSSGLIELLTELLRLDPRTRISASRALTMSFFTDMA